MTYLLPSRSSRCTVTLVSLAVLFLATAGLRLCVGHQFGWPGGNLVDSAWRLWTGRWFTEAEDTIMDIRVARLALAVLAGSSLAAGGVALQALLRNPLAEPFILGLSSGAGVGVMAQMLAGHYLGRLLGAQHLGALLGASLSMLIVYVGGRRGGLIDPLGLLLVGVVLGTINGAIIVLLNYIPGSVGLRDDLARWMIGYLNEDVIHTAAMPVVTVVTGLGIFGLFCWGKAMDVASFSDAEAVSLGVNLPRLRILLFVTASVLAAGAVVLAGPIAFVGLICPHAIRLLLGPAHRPLLIGSAMAGAILLVVADTAAVWLDFGQGRLPLGVFTAVLGGPVFICMLRPQLGRGLASSP